MSSTKTPDTSPVRIPMLAFGSQSTGFCSFAASSRHQRFAALVRGAEV
jgi:hypothetical protein